MSLKPWVVFITLIMISTIFIINLNPVSGITETKENTITVLADTTKELTINIEVKGELEYKWNIEDEGDYTIKFTLRNESLKFVDKIPFSDREGKETVKYPGEYTFIWDNTDLKKNMTIKYTITYPVKYEEETGCYTTATLMSGLILFGIFSTFGMTSKKH